MPFANAFIGVNATVNLGSWKNVDLIISGISGTMLVI